MVLTWDNVLHTILMAFIAAIAVALGVFVSPWVAAWWAGTIAGLLREATQIQSNHEHDNFLKGWAALFNWNTSHFSEWFYPSIALAGLLVLLKISLL